MLDTEKIVLVLWAKQFDEVVATTSVTELKRFGWVVQLVGLTGQFTKGQSGLNIQPNIMLEAARELLSDTAAVIIPCNFESWQIIQHDPRLREFLTQLLQSKTLLLVSETVASTLEVQNATAPVLVYPKQSKLTGFLRRIFNL